MGEFIFTQFIDTHLPIISAYTRIGLAEDSDSGLLRIIFGPKKEKLMRRRGKLHNEELHN
jgi:hypothetical protein